MFKSFLVPKSDDSFLMNGRELSQAKKGKSYFKGVINVCVLSFFVTFFSVLIIFYNQNAAAASYDYINFQGKLTDAAGFGVASETKSITFCIFSASSGGSCTATPSGQLWYETKNVTTDARGLFNTALGDTTAFGTLFTNNSNNDLYLAINVAGDGEMTPRHPIGSVPKAFNTERLLGNTWAAPGTIGGTTPAAGYFTTLSASTSLATNSITTYSGSDISFNSKNFTSVGTIGSGAITSTGAIQGTTLTATATGNAIVLSNASGATIAFTGAGTGQITTATNQNLTLIPGGTGNVGIGAASPSEKLDVNGRVHLSQTTAPGTVTDKLYNVSGSLYWNGSTLLDSTNITNAIANNFVPNSRFQDGQVSWSGWNGTTKAVVDSVINTQTSLTIDTWDESGWTTSYPYAWITDTGIDYSDTYLVGKYVVFTGSPTAALANYNMKIVEKDSGNNKIRVFLPVGWQNVKGYPATPTTGEVYNIAAIASRSTKSVMCEHQYNGCISSDYFVIPGNQSLSGSYETFIVNSPGNKLFYVQMEVTDTNGKFVYRWSGPSSVTGNTNNWQVQTFGPVGPFADTTKWAGAEIGAKTTPTFLARIILKPYDDTYASHVYVTGIQLNGGNVAYAYNPHYIETEDANARLVNNLTVGGNLAVGNTTGTGKIYSYINSAATTSQYTGYFDNQATNVTTDGINKYGLYINSTGTFTGSSGTATNNYGLYVNTPTGADNNYAAVFAGGNVGIGTTSPQKALDVTVGGSSGNVTTAATFGLTSNPGGVHTGTAIELRWRDINNEGVKIAGYHNGTGATMGFYTGSTPTENMTIDHLGKVGIGTTSPGSKLQINQSADDEGLRIYGYDDMVANYGRLGITSAGQFDIDSTGGFYLKKSGTTVVTISTGFMRIQDNNQFRFGNDNDYSMGYNSADDTLRITDGSDLTTTPRITINSSGNVGIGVSSPLGRLHSYISNAAVTTSQYTGYFENLATNSTTDEINKYGMYITSTGDFPGSGDTDTNNYGLYINTPTGADWNYSIYSAGGYNYFGGNISVGNQAVLGTDYVITANQTQTGSASGYGVVGQMIQGTNGNANTVTGVRGVSGIYSLGSNTLAWARGVEGQVSAGSSGTITNGAAFYAMSPAFSGYPTITNSYGLYTEDFGSNYAIYSIGGRAYFGGNVGIGDTSPASLLTVGNGDLFQVDSNGDMVKIKNLTYSWPSSHVSNGFLTNNGSGTLTWTTTVPATSLAWNNLTNPTGNMALSTMGSYTSTFTYGNATSTNNLFNLTDTASNTGTGYMLNVTTASGSTLKPFHVSAAGTEAITVLASGYVGIGTATPGYGLTVQAPAGSDVISWRNPTYELGRLGYGSTNDTGWLSLNDAGTKRVQLSASSGLSSFIDGSSLGIGTQTPQGLLHVHAAGSASGNYALFTNNVGGYGYPSSTGGLAIGWNQSGGLGEVNLISYKGAGSSGGTRFQNWNGSALTTAMTILADGNVGIGTTTPSEKLVVGDDLGALSPATAIVVGDTDGTTGFVLGQTSTANTFFRWNYNATPASAYGEFVTYGYSNPIRIDGSVLALQAQSGGNVGIGTTSPTTILHLNSQQPVLKMAGSGTVAQSYEFFQFVRGAVGSEYGWDISSNVDLAADKFTIRSLTNGAAVSRLTMLNDSGYVGIATTTPAQKLDINGGHLRFTPVDPPQVTATLALNGAGVLTGDYYYKYTYYTNDGETSPGAFSLKISPSSQKVLVTMTNSTNPLTVGKKLYRAKTASSSPYYYVATIADNTTTTYDDNIADTSLGTADVKYKSNETAGKIYNGTYLIGFASTNPTGNTTWGSGALADSIGGYSVAVGSATLGYSSSNSYNTAVGGSALGFVSTGDGNTAIGYGAGLGPKGLTYTTSIGRSSGRSLTIAGPSGTAVAGAGIAVGTYYYGVSFVYTLDGVTQESERSFVSSGITTTADNGQINLTSIAKYTGPLNCTARKIYRTKLTDPFTSANEKTMYLVDTIADNTTTTYSDTKAEASLGAAFAGFNASTAIGAGSLFYGSNQLIIGGVDATYNLPINNVYWGSGVYGISGTKPNDITIHSSGGFGTDIGGSNMIFAGGKASGSGASGYIAFQTGDVGASGTGEQTLTEKVKIGVGEMVVNDTGASYDFRVEGDTDANLLFTDASADSVGVGTDTPGYKFQVKIDSSNEGHVDATGAWARSSDARLKTNVTNLENTLNSLLQLRSVRYDSIGDIDTETGKGAKIGFIAQEVETLFPEFVGTDKNGYKSIAYESFVPVIVNGIQEQQKQLSGYGSSINTLNSTTTGLESLIKNSNSEIFSSTQDLNISDVVSLKSNAKNEIIKSELDDDPAITGVVTEILSDNQYRVTYSGRVKAKVSVSKGEILSGSLLTTSKETPGTAVKSTDGSKGTLGVALDLTNQDGEIEILVRPNYTPPTVSTGGLTPEQSAALAMLNIASDGHLVINGNLEVKGSLKLGNDSRGIDLVVTEGATFVEVPFNKIRDNNKYAVTVSPSWLTNVAVTQKLNDRFRVEFSSPAPINAKIDWIIIE